jgi:Ca2+-binding RTX toxin-like protein
VDTRAPNANVWITDIEVDSGVSADDFITNDTSPTILGRHGPLDAGDKIQVSGDGGLTWADAALLGGGDWSYDDPVVRGDGVVDYLARVVDGAGNVGDSDSLAVTVDTTALDDIVFAFAYVDSPSIPASLLIATLAAVPAGAYSFEIQSQGGSGAETFAIVADAGEVQLRTTGGGPALGENASYSVTVSVTDFVGNTYSETVGIHTGSDTAADTIVAAGGRTDVVYAYGLDDAITGGDGPDALFGGDGNDTFDYNSVGDSPRGAANRDVITGFQPGADRIDLSGIDADTSTPGDDAFVFVTMQTDEVQPNWLNWFQAGGNTYVQGDVDGNFTADFELQLAGNIDLAAADFVL